MIACTVDPDLRTSLVAKEKQLLSGLLELTAHESEDVSVVALCLLQVLSFGMLVLSFLRRALYHFAEGLVPALCVLPHVLPVPILPGACVVVSLVCPR